MRLQLLVLILLICLLATPKKSLFFTCTQTFPCLTLFTNTEGGKLVEENPMRKSEMWTSQNIYPEYLYKNRYYLKCIRQFIYLHSALGMHDLLSTYGLSLVKSLKSFFILSDSLDLALNIDRHEVLPSCVHYTYLLKTYFKSRHCTYSVRLLGLQAISMLTSYKGFSIKS